MVTEFIVNLVFEILVNAVLRQVCNIDEWSKIRVILPVSGRMKLSSSFPYYSSCAVVYLPGSLIESPIL